MSNSPTEFERLIIDLVREIKTDMQDFRNQVDKRFEQVDKRFEQVDKRFEQVDKRFEQMEHRLDRMEDEQHSMREKIMEIWDHRKEVTVKFSRNWAWQNIMFSGGISVITVVIAFLIFGK